MKVLKELVAKTNIYIYIFGWSQLLQGRSMLDQINLGKYQLYLMG